MERHRVQELERLIGAERRQRLDGGAELTRENEDLRAEVDRLNLRIQSKLAAIFQTSIQVCKDTSTRCRTTGRRKRETGLSSKSNSKMPWSTSRVSTSTWRNTNTR